MSFKAVIERHDASLWDGLRSLPLIMATCSKTTIALLRTPLSVVMGCFMGIDGKTCSSLMIAIAVILEEGCTNASLLDECPHELWISTFKGKGVSRVASNFWSVEGSVDPPPPHYASLLPNSSLAKMTGCRQKDIFD